MKTAIVGITKQGAALAKRLGRQLAADVYIKPEWLAAEWQTDVPSEDSSLSVFPVSEALSSLVGKIFPAYQAIVFIMACGIVVRCIAPYIRHKAGDPAIVVTDEQGRHVISLLSGHLGGANKLAGLVAGFTGGTPVITTATDIRQVVAFDELAAANDCRIEQPDAVKSVSAALVNGRQVAFYTDCLIQGELPEYLLPYDSHSGTEWVVVLSNRTDLAIPGDTVLTIRPRNLLLGIGCRKGVSVAQIRKAVAEFMQTNHKSLLAVKTVASLDIKKDEAGLVDFCWEIQVPLQTISAEIIRAIEHNFVCSPFVKARVGVGSVAEACAVASGKQARLICPKTIYQGITLALAEEEKVIKL